ncbi:hypothetical protein A1Q3_14145 [Aliivibrio fischeri ZF-211]|nr:hypothetical protein A1Q3_14145 [Aliivibrio fischeri ZF-211]
MARSETIISVFVASPGDVSDERNALESVVNELNRTWSRTLNLRLELVKWESDVYPNFGAYSQDVINKQINDNYDVFIAMFWSKVGSPTDVADSGTIEEFNRAYQKYTDDPNSVDIMVYFKDQAIPPSTMDFEQLQKLQQLKKQLGTQGGLYWTFDNTEDFENLLRGHLSRVAQSWAHKLALSNKNESVDASIIVAESDENIDTEDDYGLFDYLEIYEDRMSDMSSSLELMSDATIKVGTQFRRRTNEISALTEGTGGSYDRKDARKIMKLTSDDLNRYSEILESQIPITTLSRVEAFDALSKGIAISIELVNEDPEDLKLKLQGMLRSATSAQNGLIGFRDSVANLPRFTIQLNKAKRITITSLDRVLDEIRKTIKSTEDVIETIDRIAFEKI